MLAMVELTIHSKSFHKFLVFEPNKSVPWTLAISQIFERDTHPYIHLWTIITEHAISDLRFSSIFSKTTHVTETQNTPFEGSECGQNNSRRTES